MKRKNIIVRGIISIAVSGLASLNVLAEDLSLAVKVHGQRVFTTPIEWIGEQEPPTADSTALLEATAALDSGGTNAGYKSLESFLVRYPQSPWAPSLRTHLAERYRIIGRYSAAIQHWEAAWEASSNGPDGASHKIAARAVTGWVRLLASLGQKARVEELLTEAERRNLLATPYAPLLRASREGLSVMKGRPGESYRCGSLALSRVMKLLGADADACRAVRETPSPDGGFRMSELLALAGSNHIEVVAVQRLEGEGIPVPSIIHWKLNHYAAVVEESKGRYQVIDPTFDSVAWMDASTINEEASGYFIVPANQVSSRWRRLTPIEASAVHGKGYTYAADDESDHSGDDDDDDDCDPPDANDGPEGGGEPCPDGAGMAVWRISDPHMTVWAHDVPLYYRNSRGGWVKLRLSYKHRTVPRSDSIVSFGDNWECNWVGFVERDNAQPATIKNYLAGGGAAGFPTNGTVEYWSARSVKVETSGARIESAGATTGGTPTSAGNGTIWRGPATDGGSSSGKAGGNDSIWSGRLPGKTPAPQKAPVGGSHNHYGFPISYGVGITRYFLTNRVDRYGRIVHYGYTNINVGGTDYVRLTSMKDKDGRTNTLSYTNTAFPRLVTSVTDPYGRSAYLIYDSSGRLTNIVDMAGLSSYFKYDSSGAMTNMVTPYGTNSFRYFDHADEPGWWSRGVEVTEPTGDKQFSAYHEAVAGGVWPPPMYHHMHSYHWNRKQYSALSAGGKADPLGGMSVADFDLAPRTEWLRTDADWTIARLIGSPWKKEGPKDAALDQRSDYVQYTYPSQTNNVPQTFNRIVRFEWGNGDQMELPRNSSGRPTEFKYYRNGQWVSFTNQFNADGRRLESVWGPNGEHVRGYGYDPTLTNLLTSVTNAAGDVIRYTHDAGVRVTSITHPGGMVTTNIYYSSGANAGFLQMRMDIGFRTNNYTWLNGNLAWETNELGLATKRTWDSLNRLTSISFPDGTTVSNTYDKLDLIATKDRLDHWTTFGYNRLRELVARTNANGRVTQWEWCNCGSPSQITEWNGSAPLTTQYNYDIAGRLTNVVFPDGYAVNYQYDLSSRVSLASDSAQTQLELTYTNYGQLSSAKISAGGSGGGTFLARTYDIYGRPATATNRENVTTTFNYDVLGRLTNQTVLNGGSPSIQTFAWTTLGLANRGDELGRTNWFAYDTSGRLIFETNAENQFTAFTYNPADQLLTLTDAKSQVTKWNYDAEGRVTNKVDAANSPILRYKYDPEARLTNRWTAEKGDTFYTYDPIGNLTNVDYPGTVMDIAFQYDLLDRLTNVVDAIGTTKFTYTDGGQLLTEDGPWFQDTVSYGYSNRRRTLLSLLQFKSSAWTQSYAYDGISRLTNVTSAAGSFNYVYLDDISERVRFLNLPGSGWNNYITNQFDSLARLTSTALFTPLKFLAANSHAYQYNEAHQRIRQTFTEENNYIDYVYDKIGQLKSAQGSEWSGAARLHEQFGYGYDAAGNLNYRTNNALVQTFTVNSLNQLSNATRSGTLTVAGQTSLPGGIDNVTVSGTGLISGTASVYADGSWARSGATLADGDNTYTAVATEYYGYNGRTAQDSVTVNLPATVNFKYDNSGNLTNDGRRVFEYDYENQLTNLYVANTWRSEFKYDAFGRRRLHKEYAWVFGAWQLTTEVRYVYDGMLVVQERDGNNLAQVSYTRGTDLSGNLQGAGGISGLLARTDNSTLNIQPSNAHAYYHCDGSGNVTAMVNGYGAIVALYRYDPFGNLLGMAGPLAEANLFRFSSKEWHANAGLYYYGFRYYEPNLQRWVNRDPLGDINSLPVITSGIAPWVEAASETAEDDPRTTAAQINGNLYGMTSNKPVNMIDPFGLAECEGGLGPGSLNPENLKALDMRSAGEIARAKLQEQLRRSTLDAIQESKVFGNGLKGSRSIDISKLKQVLSRHQLEKAKEIAQNGIRIAKEELQKASTDKRRQGLWNQIETQINRARACKRALEL